LFIKLKLFFRNEKDSRAIEAPKKPNKMYHSSKSNIHNKDTSGDSSPETDEEDELADRGRQDQSDLPSEYWQIQKLVKYLKVLFFQLNLKLINLKVNIIKGWKSNSNNYCVM
jgi:hypothetical protein